MGQIHGSWEVITDEDFDSKFLNSLTYGSMLGFRQFDGTMKHWKVCRVDRAGRKWWLKPWKLYDPNDMTQLQADRRQKMQDDFNQELTKVVGEDHVSDVRDLMAKHAFYQIPTAMGRTTTIRTTDNDAEPLLTYDEWEEAYEQHEASEHFDDGDDESDPGPVPAEPPAPETDTKK